jgi:LEA14-like dessication related protein
MYLRTLFVTATLTLALLSGCTALVQEPRVAYKDATLSGLDTSGIDVDFLLGITNPNSFDLSLLGYTYELQVQTLPLSAGDLQKTVIFPAGKETDLQVPVHLKFADLLRIIRQSSDPDRIPCLINARLKLKTPLGDMLIPVEKQIVLTLPEQYRPAAYIDRLRDTLRSIR